MRILCPVYLVLVALFRHLLTLAVGGLEYHTNLDLRRYAHMDDYSTPAEPIRVYENTYKLALDDGTKCARAPRVGALLLCCQ